MPTDWSAGPSAVAAPKSSDTPKHASGFHRAKITSAMAISPWPLDSPSFQVPG